MGCEWKNVPKQYIIMNGLKITRAYFIGIFKSDAVDVILVVSNRQYLD